MRDYYIVKENTINIVNNKSQKIEKTLSLPFVNLTLPPS